jgi:hypothetical protein
LCIRSGRLHVVSTGTDEVVAYDLLRHRPIWRERVWTPTGANCDVHHINALAEIRGELWCSALGPKDGKLWSEARRGYIRNITRQHMVMGDLWHPHSLMVHRGKVYFCDSSRLRVKTLEGYVVAEAPGGYVRGLSIRKSNVFVGSSVGRTQSMGPGVDNPADPGEPSGLCAVRRFDLMTGTCLETFDLSGFGTEVYDVLAL